MVQDILEKHKKWLNDEDGGERANLRGAYLRGADLQGAYLQGADMDYSCFPLWCGGARFKCSEKLVQQLFAHICTLDVVDASTEMKEALIAIKSEALKSYRAEDLGLLKGGEDE